MMNHKSNIGFVNAQTKCNSSNHSLQKKETGTYINIFNYAIIIKLK